jgi:hypothetical protein
MLESLLAWDPRHKQELRLLAILSNRRKEKENKKKRKDKEKKKKGKGKAIEVITFMVVTDVNMSMFALAWF